ncbi:MAG: RnfH family protein [Betaproteobacteria bacterium]|nr:RnfH family protein [Betaproteobacteria bacterium]
MADEAAGAPIAVEVVFEQTLVQLELPENSTVEDAIRACGLLEKYPEIDLRKNKLGIYSRPARLDTRLRHRDRVEIYQPLIADPKEVRSRRAAEGKSV